MRKDNQEINLLFTINVSDITNAKKTKVSYDHFIVLDEYIFTFQIAMNDTFRMKVTHSLK